MGSDKIYFGEIKEDRGWYFIEYSPPHESFRFALLNIVVPEQAEKEQIVQAIETEVRAWFSRYPIPIMATAFDATGSVLRLSPIKDCDSLIGFVPKGQTSIVLHWRSFNDNDLRDDALNRDQLKKVYANVPFRTSAHIERETKKHAQAVLAVKWIFIFATVLFPLAVLILPEISRPVAVVLFVYGILKIIIAYLKQTGVLKKSQREIEREKDELAMRHHHHHCKLNPEAFQRLKIENFEREEREKTLKEAEALKKRN